VSTPPSDDGLLREVTREVLAELLPGLLEEALTGAAAAAAAGNGNGHGHAPAAVSPAHPGAVPVVPAPPVAAVHRPPGWAPPTAEPSPAPATAQPATAVAATATGRGVEQVDLRTDAELDAFVRMLLRRFENPRDRAALRSGKLRFALRAGAAPAAAGKEAAVPVIRIERGAANERTVRQAAEEGARIVLAPGAVITPMGRDAARSLNVEIEKERRC
jgi:hypothetical protein